MVIIMHLWQWWHFFSLLNCRTDQYWLITDKANDSSKAKQTFLLPGKLTEVLCACFSMDTTTSEKMDLEAEQELHPKVSSFFYIYVALDVLFYQHD